MDGTVIDDNLRQLLQLTFIRMTEISDNKDYKGYEKIARIAKLYEALSTLIEKNQHYSSGYKKTLRKKMRNYMESCISAKFSQLLPEDVSFRDVTKGSEKNWSVRIAFLAKIIQIQTREVKNPSEEKDKSFKPGKQSDLTSLGELKEHVDAMNENSMLAFHTATGKNIEFSLANLFAKSPAHKYFGYRAKKQLERIIKTSNSLQQSHKTSEVSHHARIGGRLDIRSYSHDKRESHDDESVTESYFSRERKRVNTGSIEEEADDYNQDEISSETGSVSSSLKP